MILEKRQRQPRNGLFDLVAPVWDQIIGRWGQAQVFDALALEGRLRILDLAGGTGRLAHKFEALGHQVAVVDLSAPMTSRAARKGLPTSRARAEAVPFADGVFDRIVILDALHHMAEIDAVASELARLLAPGGRAVLFEPDPASWTGRWIERLERWARMGSLFHDGRQLQKLLESAGLETTIHRSSFHLVAIAQKSSTNAPR